MKRKPPSSSVERAAAAFLNERRGRAAIRSAPGAGKAASRILKPLAERFGPGLEVLTEHWTEIVGPRLAAWCAPEALQRGVLVIRARGPAGAVIQAEAPRILDRVKLYAGQRAPVRLRVVQGASRAPLTKPQAAASRASAAGEADTKAMHEKVEADAKSRLVSLLDTWGKGVSARKGR